MKRKIKVKFCGLQQAEHIRLAKQLGVNAVGLVFVPKSPRFVNLEQAVELSKVARRPMQLVALFANQDAELIEQVIEQVKPDILQFHGTETVQFCEQFAMPYWKAIPMLENVNDWQQSALSYHKASAILLDAFGERQSGGSGEPFNWFKFPQDFPKQLILAGGVNQHNLSQAIEQTACDYIDLSSGIEVHRGVKSPQLMRQFMETIAKYDN